MNLTSIKTTHGDMKLRLNSEGNFYEIDEGVTIDNYIKIVPFYQESPLLRKVVLRKIPKKGYFISTLKEIKVDNAPKTKDKHRGHFIANMFKPFLRFR